VLNEGYVKLYRSMTKWEWYDDINTKVLFLHLLLTVNHCDKQWHGILVKRGSRISSYGKLASETGLSVKSVRTAINHLKSTGEVAHQATPNYGLFTVINYEKYQQRADETADEGQTRGRRGADEGQQSKNDKNDKNDKNRESELEPKTPQLDYQGVVDMFHTICVSLPKLRLINEGRKKAIKAANERLKDIGGFEALFNAVEESDFLTGRNGKWNGCGFDWILKPANMTKIIEGNFANRDKPAKPKKETSFDIDEYEEIVRRFIPRYQKRGD
jgi:biotin operon repressor